MPHIIARFDCCGLTELAKIGHGSAQDSLRVASVSKAAWVIFTDIDITNFKYGEALAALIKEENLGPITITPEGRRNPNSSNRIRAYLWSPDYPKVHEYVAKQNRIVAEKVLGKAIGASIP